MLLMSVPFDLNWPLPPSSPPHQRFLQHCLHIHQTEAIRFFRRVSPKYLNGCSWVGLQLTRSCCQPCCAAGIQHYVASPAMAKATCCTGGVWWRTRYPSFSLPSAWDVKQDPSFSEEVFGFSLGLLLMCSFDGSPFKTSHQQHSCNCLLIVPSTITALFLPLWLFAECCSYASYDDETFSLVLSILSFSFSFWIASLQLQFLPLPYSGCTGALIGAVFFPELVVVLTINVILLPLSRRHVCPLRPPSFSAWASDFDSFHSSPFGREPMNRLGASATSHLLVLSRWWFQIFSIFTPTWGRFPFWLTFVKGVETTN